MTSHPSDGYHQLVVNGRSHPGRGRSRMALMLAGQRSAHKSTLTTPLPPPLKAVETCSVLLSIADLGCIELVAVVDVENTSQPISQPGPKKVTHG